MRVAGSAVIGVQRERLWAALQDPAVLVRTIPGCERLEETGPGAYRMTVNAGVASVKGVYQGEVVLAEPVPPESFTLRARGQGAPGTVEAVVRLRLSEESGQDGGQEGGQGGGTRVEYDAEAVIGGMIGGVGQRMLGSVAKRTAGQFFAAVERHLSGGAEVGERADAVEVRGAVHERPVAARAQAGTRPWVMLASFGTGAGVALTGVAVGWLLGRGSRRPRG
ncbi:carbon monoxide dehydrogenase subunit G [Nonomuraea sp. NPDC050783]|uniref:SRPBCC family protein n=1 Tax=Nonomuraea sp. NPDC050783 TaxID=3154634 RepID=UPI0034650635